MSGANYDPLIRDAMLAAGIDPTRPCVVTLQLCEGTERTVHIRRHLYLENREAVDEVARTFGREERTRAHIVAGGSEAARLVADVLGNDSEAARVIAEVLG